MSPRSLRPLLVVAVLSLLAAACGSTAERATRPDPEVLPPPTIVQAPNPLFRQVPVNDPTTTVELELTGVPPLGPDADYEIWYIVDGEPISGGTFDVMPNGELWSADRANGALSLTGRRDASKVVITIEPSPDPDPGPAATHILAGNVAPGGAFVLTIDDAAALGTDFSRSSGSALLATPTDGPDTNETSGVWFLDGATKEPSLVVPGLPDGWNYEGWVVINGLPVSTGTFRAVDEADDASPHSGELPGPPVPGEDFLVDPPEGLIFPEDLSGQTIVITVEPSPDNSPEPFVLKPLAGDIPDPATPGADVPLVPAALTTTGYGRIG